MFICSECHAKPCPWMSRSFGPCEICKNTRECSDCRCDTKRPPPPPITDREIDVATFYSKQAVEKLKKSVEKALTDTDATARLKAVECRNCFYLRRGGVVGRAFTDYCCRGCAGTFSHPDTGVPKLCTACATSRGICCRCLADLNDQKREPEPVVKAGKKSVKRSKKG